MSRYIIYFNQQWVGDHPAEWYETRGLIEKVVVEEIKTASTCGWPQEIRKFKG